MKLSGKPRGLGEKSRNEIHLPASMRLSAAGITAGRAGRAGRAPGDREGACRPDWSCLPLPAVGTWQGRGCQGFLIYNRRAPSDPIP